MGIVKTKGLARSYVWWPNIDADVAALCETCATEADASPRAPPNPWPYLPPWSRVHIDFLEPYKGKSYLVLIDSSSKWLEIIEVARTCELREHATSIIKVLSKQSTTGESPAMLLQRRSLRSRLDLLRGGYVVQARVLDAQQRQVEYAGGVPRNFYLGDTVWIRDYGTRDKRVKGTVAQKEVSGRYVLDNGDGRLIKRHIDQIIRRSRLSDVNCPDIPNEVDEKDEDEFADATSEL
ncbi:unnamed protein product [Parnassius mnemosyne]|uniref:RNA-directed DNA polymerase n=1 Tax=Parnassius mnemosyne TaxID=213953 RepID=A0AAV1LMC7_9NEOP